MGGQRLFSSDWFVDRKFAHGTTVYRAGGMHDPAD